MGPYLCSLLGGHCLWGAGSGGRCVWSMLPGAGIATGQTTATGDATHGLLGSRAGRPNGPGGARRAPGLAHPRRRCRRHRKHASYRCVRTHKSARAAGRVCHRPKRAASPTSGKVVDLAAAPRRLGVGSRSSERTAACSVRGPRLRRRSCIRPQMPMRKHGAGGGGNTRCSHRSPARSRLSAGTAIDQRQGPATSTADLLNRC